MCELDPLDFLARLLMHVPEPRLHLEPVSERERFHIASSFAEWKKSAWHIWRRRRSKLLLIRIIDYLKLRRPVYCPTAAYGHFGRKEFAWEQVDATEELQAKAKIA